MSGDIQKWADSAMFRSESHDAAAGPQVYLLAASNDPLGQIAACAKMYKGEVVRSLIDITDEERREYLKEMQKTKLKMPLEAVGLHFMLENVTRAFTHQLVRQRTAAYAQESMRFAVVEDMNEAVALPPSLSAWNDPQKRAESLQAKAQPGVYPRNESERQFWVWVDAVDGLSGAYNNLVESGMPAEDARGLMPTNIVTRINYVTNLRGLLDHAGNRLCTQAQFEWRIVFSKIAAAMREFGKTQAYWGTSVLDESDGGPIGHRFQASSEWQWNAIADLLRPVCYQTGRCQFLANFDRKCSIRNRVMEFASMDIPSGMWDDPSTEDMLGIQPIHHNEWLADPSAAR